MSVKCTNVFSRLPLAVTFEKLSNYFVFGTQYLYFSFGGLIPSNIKTSNILCVKYFSETEVWTVNMLIYVATVVLNMCDILLETNYLHFFSIGQCPTLSFFSYVV